MIVVEHNYVHVHSLKEYHHSILCASRYTTVTNVDGYMVTAAASHTLHYLWHIYSRMRVLYMLVSSYQTKPSPFRDKRGSGDNVSHTSAYYKNTAPLVLKQRRLLEIPLLRCPAKPHR